MTYRQASSESEDCVGISTEMDFENPTPIWKRLIDVCFSLAFMPLLGIMAACAAVVMKIASPGPIFFTQERVGLGGRRFKIYKFRTMKVAAETTSHQQHLKDLIHSRAPMQKLDAKSDSRMIPGARLVRATGLDELPQIINVLKGEMSVVGPRPCIPYEYEEYTEHQRQRFAAIPGLTGLWQVSGKNRTTFAKMIELDIRYARSKSFWLDLAIIVRTPLALLQQVGDMMAAPRAKRSRKTPLVGRQSEHLTSS